MDRVDQVEKFFIDFSFKRTPLRVKLLKLFKQTVSPITQAEIIEKLSKNKNEIDRISIYRNLLQMKRKGIIHEADRNKYLLCQHRCDKHPHIILYCDDCRRFSEIRNHFEVKKILSALDPLRFFNETSSLVVRGSCRSCAVL